MRDGTFCSLCTARMVMCFDYRPKGEQLGRSKDHASGVNFKLPVAVICRSVSYDSSGCPSREVAGCSGCNCSFGCRQVAGEETREQKHSDGYFSEISSAVDYTLYIITCHFPGGTNNNLATADC